MIADILIDAHAIRGNSILLENGFQVRRILGRGKFTVALLEHGARNLPVSLVHELEINQPVTIILGVAYRLALHIPVARFDNLVFHWVLERGQLVIVEVPVLYLDARLPHYRTRNLRQVATTHYDDVVVLVTEYRVSTHSAHIIVVRVVCLHICKRVGPLHANALTNARVGDGIHVLVVAHEEQANLRLLRDVLHEPVVEHVQRIHRHVPLFHRKREQVVCREPQPESLLQIRARPRFATRRRALIQQVVNPARPVGGLEHLRQFRKRLVEHRHAPHATTREFRLTPTHHNGDVRATLDRRWRVRLVVPDNPRLKGAGQQVILRVTRLGLHKLGDVLQLHPLGRVFKRQARLEGDHVFDAGTEVVVRRDVAQLADLHVLGIPPSDALLLALALCFDERKFLAQFRQLEIDALQFSVHLDILQHFICKSYDLDNFSAMESYGSVSSVFNLYLAEFCVILALVQARLLPSFLVDTFLICFVILARRAGPSVHLLQYNRLFLNRKCFAWRGQIHLGGAESPTARRPTRRVLAHLVYRIQHRDNASCDGRRYIIIVIHFINGPVYV